MRNKIKVDIITALTQEKQNREKQNRKYNWENNARSEQKLPQGDWFCWLIMAGRGFGKTRTGAEAVRHLALSGKYKNICLLAETYDEVRSIMLEGNSGLLKIHPQSQMPHYSPSKRELIWPNGARATCFSAENYEGLRGPQFDLAWIDEFAKFDNAQAVWDQLMFCLRLGNKPRVIITSTPRTKKIITEIINRKDTHLTTGSTFHNALNLPKDFLNIITEQYANTQLGKQEIEGQILSENDSQLWQIKDFRYVDKIPKELNIIIAIDPAVEANANSNETGIIVAGKDEKYFYVIEDCSGVMQPNTWAEKAYQLYIKYNATKIIVETNQGGEILMTMLRNFAEAPWQSVKAIENKYKRALPIASLYQQGKVFHTQKFEMLEQQMLEMGTKNDRLDALVWAIFTLMQSNYISVRLW
jgi:phage terminase large subunit-like protein